MICQTCHKDAECRPYGPPERPIICFDCAMKTPESKAQTDAAFLTQLVAAGPNAVIGTEAGPYPLSTTERN